MKLPESVQLYKQDGVNYVRTGNFAIGILNGNTASVFVDPATLSDDSFLVSIDDLSHPEIHEVDNHEMSVGDIAVDRSNGEVYLVILDEDMGLNINLRTREFASIWFGDCDVYSLDQLFE